jgi:flagellar motor switch protein FliN/FliY
MSEEDDLLDAAGDASGDKMADEWAAAMAESGDEVSSDDDSDEPDGATSLELEEFKPTANVSVEGGPDLDTILDIPVTIAMEVGSTAITIKNLLQLNQGSVIELDRLAGEPLDILVNGTLIAHGEVVVVNEKFGIRMTDVISPSERIKRLR